MSAIDNIVKMLPSWLKMTKKGSTGYSFLNALGIEIDDVYKALEEMQYNLYLPTIDTYIPDYIYKAEIPIQYTNFAVNLKTNDIFIVNTIYEFFKDDGRKKIIVDYENKILYANKFLDVVDIEIVNNDTLETFMYKTQFYQHHIWNGFDEFALLFGLKRFDGETNDELKKRIIDAILNMPGSDSKSIKYGIARELGLDESEVFIEDLSNKDINNDDGSISRQFLLYLNKIDSIYNLVNIKWDDEFKKNNLNLLQYIPRLYDNGLINFAKEYIQNGIGDNDDLKIELPKDESPTQNFKARIGLVGKITKNYKIYPKHKFKFKIKAKGKEIKNDYKSKDVMLTVVASEDTPIDFSVRAQKEYKLDNTVDFSDSSNILNDIELIPGNKIENIGGTSHNKIKVKIRLYSNDSKTDTPVVSSVKIKYKRNINGTITDASKNLTLNIPNNNIDIVGSDIKLAKGEYTRIYKEAPQWLQGVSTGLVVTGLGLKLPKAR